MKSDNLMIKALSSKTVWLFGFVALVLLFFTTYALFAKPCMGRVVDEITGEPIAGVVVVGSWSFRGPGATHCLDAREVVSDNRGEFELPIAVPAYVFGNLRIAIYKVGYQRVECSWKYLEMIGSCYSDKPVIFENGRAVFPLKKVSKVRLMEEGYPPDVCGRRDGKALEEYVKAHEGYRRARGLEPK
jgi:hypothetical protein